MIMSIAVFQVDAFAERAFEGNPAAVCLLESWPGDRLLQQIAMENNLSETAFLVQKGEVWELRWFTPTVEVDLCGHATLASAHVLFSKGKISGERVVFSTKKHGLLTVDRLAEGYVMDFPADEIRQVSVPPGLEQALGIPIPEIWEGREDYLIPVGHQTIVEQLAPDFRQLALVAKRGILVTAPGETYDFVSRCFFPAVGVDEDPVTGSAHTTLAPYWGKRLEQTELTGRQLSRRGGTVVCRLKGDRVELQGKAVTFLEGQLKI